MNTNSLENRTKTLQTNAVLRYQAGQHMAKTLAKQGMDHNAQIKNCIFGWVKPEGVYCKVRNNKSEHWVLAKVWQYNNSLNRFITNIGIVKHAVPLSITDHIVI